MQLLAPFLHLAKRVERQQNEEVEKNPVKTELNRTICSIWSFYGRNICCTNKISRFPLNYLPRQTMISAFNSLFCCLPFHPLPIQIRFWCSLWCWVGRKHSGKMMNQRKYLNHPSSGILSNPCSLCLLQLSISICSATKEIVARTISAAQHSSELNAKRNKRRTMRNNII